MYISLHVRKTTRLDPSKLEFSSRTPEHGDRVTRKSNCQEGTFLGYVNVAKSKCAVSWNTKRVKCERNALSVIKKSEELHGSIRDKETGGEKTPMTTTEIEEVYSTRGIKDNQTVDGVNMGTKTTRVNFAKLKCVCPPKHNDSVIRKANGQKGTFLGFVNASKTKCAVTWENIGKPNGYVGGTDPEPNAGKCDSKYVGGTERKSNAGKADLNGKACADWVNQKKKTGVDLSDVETKDDIAARHDCVNVTMPHCNVFDSESNRNPIQFDRAIRVGDLVYDRDEDGVPAKPQWMVVTQGPHRRTCCVEKCIHAEVGNPGEKGYDPDPLLVTVAPALITSTGVTNKPDPKQDERACWAIDPVQTGKAVTEMLERGYKVMCRDNYHVCLISCRKHKKKLRALYCRMRMPRRPMESTCVSQLHMKKLNRQAVDTFSSMIQTNTGNSNARPLPEIEKNESLNNYWSSDNTDVLLRPDNRALTVDLARLTGTRAIDEDVRAQVVPTVMSRLLGLLPSTLPRTTLKATFQSRPFGFTFTASESDKSIRLTKVNEDSAAAKAGLTVGMRLITLNGVNVGNIRSEHVRKLVKHTVSTSMELEFELPVPETQVPGMYHVRHKSMATAAMIVGHIETFLGHTHQYEDPRMAETNPLLASLLNCNTNVQLVGSLSAAMSVLQYLSGYLSKNPIELCNFVSCIIAARRRCKRYDSIADDAGTEDRNAKFLAQKVVCILLCSAVCS